MSLYFLWFSDAIWRHRSGSTLAQVMACCLTEPSHYVNQAMLIDHQRCSVAFTWEQFHKKCSWTLIHNMFSEITHLKLLPHLPGANELSIWADDIWFVFQLFPVLGAVVGCVPGACLPAPGHHLCVLLTRLLHPPLGAVPPAVWRARDRGDQWTGSYSPGDWVIATGSWWNISRVIVYDHRQGV